MLYSGGKGTEGSNVMRFFGVYFIGKMETRLLMFHEASLVSTWGVFSHVLKKCFLNFFFSGECFWNFKCCCPSVWLVGWLVCPRVFYFYSNILISKRCLIRRWKSDSIWVMWQLPWLIYISGP